MSTRTGLLKFVPLASLVSAQLVGLPATMAAAANEACVRCDNPFAIYRCEVDEPGLPPNASIALICITALAKQHGHATCAVSRDQGDTCGGERVTVAPSPDAPIPQAPPPGLAIAKPATSEPQPSASAAVSSNRPASSEAGTDPAATPQAPTPAEASPAAPPETVEQFAKDTAKASEKGLKTAGGAVVDAAKKTGETIEKTGDAIGTAAKKTWRCITSLFGNC